MSVTPTPEQVTCRRCPATHPVTLDTIAQMHELLDKPVDLLNDDLPLIDGWLITIDWTAHCPEHLGWLYSPDPTPTNRPCPPWCTVGAGHPYDVTTQCLETPDARIHDRSIGTAGDVTIRISAIEHVHLGEHGITIDVEPPTVEDFEVGELEADQADELAHLLHTAAAQLRAIRDCAPTGRQ